MVFEKLKTIIIEEFEIEEELITMTTSLTDELDIDSLDLVDLVMTVEDEFSIELPDEALEGMKTIGDLVKYIEEN
ncbi:MAG: acyl carrier protein [Clostridia bacterium]|jgi:acyl carrier protein|nr:acyl carrier protein [Oscillospiraceae bacterium]MBQ6935388.1 acyl carrier protein [Clostridia bacterium]MBR3809255.1 acyl carrier protein [Clostridia bacterium]